MSADGRILTIGHSNHSWEAFLKLLRGNGVEVLVDTRSVPTSRWADFANGPSLKGLLGRAGIDYVFMGDSLGGKPADPDCYDGQGKPDYRKMRSKVFFHRGIGEMLQLAKGTTVALMCAEEDPSKCHRRLLIGPALEERGFRLRHIRGDGSVQSQDSLGNKKAYQRQLQGRLFPEDPGP